MTSAAVTTSGEAAQGLTAIASGMPPSAGLIAGALGGGIAALLGSSQFQVSGPAAALTVMVLSLVKQFGTPGVAAATVYVGIVEVVLALALAGRVVRYVPESVLAGFTTGVGLKLLDGQIPELLGFPEVVDWASRGTPTSIDLVTMMHHPRWLHDVSWLAAVSGVFVIAMAGLILYQTSEIIHGGETNYILATVTLYVSIYNLFTSLLHLLGAASDD